MLFVKQNHDQNFPFCPDCPVYLDSEVCPDTPFDPRKIDTGTELSVKGESV